MDKKSLDIESIINQTFKELKDEYDIDEFNEIDESEINEILDEEDSYYSSATITTSLRGLSYEEIAQLKVTEHSYFHANKWTIPSAHKPTNLYFEYEFSEHESTKDYPELILFLKCLTLYRVPNHTENVTSNRTALMELFTLKRFISFCFIDNQLFNPILDCSKITLHQINKALDKSRDEGSHANYREVAKGLRLWINLTASEVLPIEFDCPFAESEIFTNGRVREIIKHNLQMGTYIPLSEDEIAKIADNSFKWIETYGQDICFLNEHINKHENFVFKTRNNSDFERVVIKKDSVSGQEILRRAYAIDKTSNIAWFSPIFASDLRNSDSLYLKDIHESSKNLLGACISIILLITGMRIRELQNLKVGCCIPIDSNLYKLNYKIFKTASNSEHGENADFPVPKIIFTAVSLVERLLTRVRSEIDSDFLFVGYEFRKSRYKFCDSATLRRFLRRIIDDENVKKNIHPHRFRKTIAWLLISRSERNIDIIRQLFGHRSYKMTLEYILRNYELVDEVVNQLRINYAQDFYDLTKSIISGHYSGPAADRLARSIKSNPSSFNSQVLRLTLTEYVTALLESGEPIFIHRVPVGAWCLSVPVLGSKPTPCTAKLQPTDRVAPDIRFCKYEDCDKFAGTPDAIPGIERNIVFYKKILNVSGMDSSLRKKYEHKLAKNEEHLSNIKSKRPLLDIFDSQGNA